MQITLFSLLWSAVWCVILSALIWLLRKSGRCPAKVSVPLYNLCILRALLPLDLPAAAVIPERIVYTDFYLWIVGRYTSGPSAGCVLGAVWFIGACVLFLRYAFAFRKAERFIHAYAYPAAPSVQGLLRQIAGDQRHPISVLVLPGIGSPFGTGILRKRILLPSDACEEKAMLHILQHEYTHFQHHDILLKQLTAVFCIIFWWNPAVLLLKRDMEQSIELRCDACVTRSMNRNERIAYLETILHTLRNQPPVRPPYTSVTLSRQNAGLMERFDAVMTPDTRKPRRMPVVLLICCFAALLIFSYATILQPDRDPPPSEDPDVLEFDATTSYIVHKQNGEYWIYFQDETSDQLSKEELELYTSAGFTIIEE